MRARAVALTVPVLGLAACGTPSAVGAVSSAAPSQAGIHRIQHVVVIMQENRSFDEYFGLYPGADGLPRQNGQFTVCVPNPAAGGCVRPFHDPADVNAGGPHGAVNATDDVNGRRMDGFVAQAEAGKRRCASQFDPACTNGNKTDVMGYKDARDIPNYWAYAQSFVLQDRMFEPNASWSLPEHLFMVSEWSARCSKSGDPSSCVNALQNAEQNGDYAWTDLTYLLHRANVSWRYYVAEGTQPGQNRRESG